MQQGWIRVHRSLTEHWLHEDKPFGQFGAWVDLLLMANHEARKMPIEGQIIVVQRGQMFTSVRSLATRWGWSKVKVSRFLTLLENDEMVKLERSKSGTLLTLVNYDNYQDCRDDKKTPSGHQADTERTQSGRNKELKNDKNVKNEKKDIYTSAITEILNYLNLRTGKKYTGRSKAQREHIIARLKEGYTVDEFKTVIDNKVKAWGHDDKMRQYLRPETLFSTKFETYLNDTETERQRARREDHESDEKQREAIRRAGTVEIGYRE